VEKVVVHPSGSLRILLAQAHEIEVLTCCSAETDLWCFIDYPNDRRVWVSSTGVHRSGA